VRTMPITDAFFLISESRRIPMHVGGLNLYTLPKGVDETDFFENMAEILSYDGELRRPFADKIKMGPLGAVGKIHWEEDDDLDMDYHVRRSALPRPGRYRELFSLVSRLHGTLLDRSRPLWEFHMIEGLHGRQIATYFKAHHCAVDGMAAMHLMNSMYSNDPNAEVTISPFSQQALLDYKKRVQKGKSRDDAPKEMDIRAAAEAIKSQLGSTVSLARAMRETAGTWLGKDSPVTVPFHNVPASALSTKLTGARRFVAQSWSFERVRAVGKAFDGTLNDAVLAMCAGALRKQLKDQRGLPKEPLTAMAPVSVRAAGDVDGANAVGMVFTDLATNVRDPAKRMRRIKDSMDSAKEQLEQMSPREIVAYTAMTQVPLLLAQLAGMGSRFPACSTIISNVPGTREQLYWNGARVDGIYPASIPMDGMAINFTVVSNYENLDFGITACRKSMPQVQRLIDYMEDALVELEDAAGISSKGKAKAKVAVKRKAAAKREIKRKPKVEARPKGESKAQPKGGASARPKVAAKAQSKRMSR
jgi:diacylglycerol O-acyltransferase